MQKTAYTTSKYRKLLREIGSCFDLVGEYQGMSKKQDHRCKKCKEISCIKPCNVVHVRQGCRNCVSFEARHKTIAYYLKKHPALIKKWKFLEPVNSLITNSKVLVRCRTCKHEFSPIIHNIARGSGCPKCSKQLPWSTERLLLAQVQKNRKDLTWINKEVTDLSSVIKFLCPTHGEVEYTVAQFISSPLGCKQCSMAKGSEKHKFTQKEFLKIAKQIHGDTLLYDRVRYKGMHEEIILECPEHGTFRKGAKEVIHQQQGCPTCGRSRTITRPHAMVNEWLASFGLEIRTNDRKQLEGFEIDSFIPSKQLGIEVNGVYWHSEKFTEKKAHQFKYKLAAAKSISLLQFWDKEILERPKIVRSMLKVRLGMANRVFARNTSIKSIDKVLTKKFLNATHLQGAGNLAGSISYGLVQDNKLLMIMVFCKSRFDKTADWEIYRISSRLGQVVIGGASKLLAHFIATQKPRNIISYADCRYSSGNVYQTMDFKHLRDTAPGYFYSRGLDKISRFSARRICSQSNLTEVAHMETLGYSRVFDAGNSVWIKNIDNMAAA